MDVRPYAPSDRAACLDIFDSNTPQFFHPVERPDFEAFLNLPDCAYFVMEHEGGVVGCGGYAIAENGAVASLVWGMIRTDLHGHGLGRFLLLFRLREIGRAGGVQMVRLGTSQRTAAFFGKQGFKTISVDKDGYAPGIDRIEMAMKLAVCA
ncbi:MAG TPA: GNAT family N-acetyltransferase [Bryobacteraceae bacterium]|jgi:GNAT superfamily N-acetyltransferase